jgi:hypothetical protein
MFKLKQSDTFLWPVTVQVPADGGRYVRETFDGEFRRLPQSRLAELNVAITAGEMDDATFVREVLAGWQGVTDDGEEVPFSVASLNTLLDMQGVARAIVLAYRDALAGMLRKN